MMGGFKCTCNVCKYAHEVDRHLSIIKDMGCASSVEFFEGMYNRLCGAQMDNDVNRAMLNGDWPSGKLVYVPKCTT